MKIENKLKWFWILKIIEHIIQERVNKGSLSKLMDRFHNFRAWLLQMIYNFTILWFRSGVIFSKKILTISLILNKMPKILFKLFISFAGKNMSEIVLIPVHYLLMSTKTKQKRKIPEKSKIQKLLFPLLFPRKLF